MNPLKIGILSAAHMHADSYVAEIAAHPGVTISGFWDADATRRAAKAAQYSAKAFADADALAAASDALVVCSENIHHRALVEIAARHGKPVLCEKPLATTPADARAMVETCRAAGVPLFTAFPCRFSPAFLALEAAARRGDLGAVLAVRATNRGKCPGGWFVDLALSGGGAVMDHTVHVTDLLRVLLQSEVARVYCEADSRLVPGDFDDTGVVTLEFESGAFATLDCSWSRPAKTFPTWGDVTMGVQGTKAAVELDMFAQNITRYDEAANHIRLAWYGSRIDGGLVAAFVRAVTTGEQTGIATGEDGLRAVEVVAAAYKSARTHTPVAVVRG